MADSVELRMSVTSIKRVDPYVKDILATATHVALYKFNTSTNEWEKTETEGALFIYSRNGEPFHSIMVMNRLNTDNLIEPIVKEFDYQMQVPFLLYRNSKSKIFGIWFFNREECIRITFLIESIMERLKDNSDDSSKRNKENGVDIFSMLSKAQEDFNKTPTKQDSSSVGAATFSSTPRIPDVTSSVMDFFAKASTKSAGKGENMLQRLMSNPAHSVEHIEKQQRSITPQDQVIRFNQSENNGIFRQSPQPKSSPLMMLLNQSQTPAAAPPVEDNSTDVLGTSPFAQFLSDSSNKPQLMTPMMFTNSHMAAVAKEKDQKEDKLEVDLLTEKQLAQALIYLLKNNSDFTKQIHEAYVNSILDRVNLSSNAANKSLI